MTIHLRIIPTTRQAVPVEEPTGVSLPPGKFMRVLHDYEARDGLIRVGMPAVLSMYLNQYTDLTSAWQWTWFRHMVHSFTNYTHWSEQNLSPAVLSTLKGKWQSLTKHSEAFTNFKGTSNYKDYVTPNNLQGLPGQEPLVCTGNIVKVLGAEIRLAGKWWIPVETLDGTKAPPLLSKVNRLTRPDLILSATNCAAFKPLDKDGKPVRDSSKWTVIYLPNGTWRIDPFPQLAPRHTPFMLRTNGTEADKLKANLRSNGNQAPAGRYSADGIYYAVNYVRADRLAPVTGSFVPNPFNPPQ